MEIPRYTPAQQSSLELPEIFVQGSSPSDPYRSSSRSINYSSRFAPAASAKPMSIPGLRDPPPPPPLPPPRVLHLNNDDGSQEPDVAWLWENSRQEQSWKGPSPSINPGSSLYGSFASGGKSVIDERPDTKRRGSSASTIKSISGVDARRNAYPRIDEGYASLSGTSFGSNS